MVGCSGIKDGLSGVTVPTVPCLEGRGYLRGSVPGDLGDWVEPYGAVCLYPE